MSTEVLLPKEIFHVFEYVDHSYPYTLFLLLHIIFNISSFRTQICNLSNQEYVCHKEVFISLPSKPKMSNRLALIIGGTDEIGEVFGRDLLNNGAKVFQVKSNFVQMQ